MMCTDREPKAFFRYFERISAIPRCSYHEQAVADYLCQFAAERNLVCMRDEMHNVMIKKDASKGAKAKDAVLLQGHTDMVCEKNAGTAHDFACDPIHLVVNGDYLRAEGTTLGADNGVAVAMMLAILDDDTLAHPPLECLFTVREEVGLLGAAALAEDWICAKTMINLDSGPEDTAVVSCAGGMRMDIDKRFVPEKVTQGTVKLSITGLAGGHSGACIDQHRANAIKLMGRLLHALPPFHLVSIDGGNKENAIPRECFAVLSAEDPEALIQAASAIEETIRGELAEHDKGFRIQAETCANPAEQMSARDSKDLVSLIMLAPDGVLYHSHAMEDLVETSVNLGVIRTGENSVKLTFSPRSSVDSRQQETEARLCLLSDTFSCDSRAYNRYPGWNYDPHSKVRRVLGEVHEALFGKALKIQAVHAGLECGILSSKAPGLDIVATGAKVNNAHTPDEELYMPSIDRLWKAVAELLRRYAAQD